MPDNEINKNDTDIKEDTPEEGDKAAVSGGQKVSVLENVRKMNEKARRDELIEESRVAAEKAEAERAQREKYSKKLAEERIELMKLRQGVISEEDMPKEEEAPEKVYTFSEKVGNFFYHYKMYVIIFGFLAALAAFLVYDFVTNKKPDVSMLVIAKDPEFVTRVYDIQALLEPYCEDFNRDGLVYLQVSYLPAVIDDENSADVYYSQADQTRLVAEFQTPDSIMVLTDDLTSEYLDVKSVFSDMREIYPDDKNAFEHGYMINGTKLAENIGYPALSDELYLAFRTPRSGFGSFEKFKTNYENALKVWDNYLNGNKVSENAEHYSDRRGE